MKLILSSFSYKSPPGFDSSWLVFDCRNLRNPYNLPEFAGQTGEDATVSTFVMCDPNAIKMFNEAVESIVPMIEMFQPKIFVAFGCVGGIHRSVVLRNRVGKHFKERGVDTVTLSLGASFGAML